MVFYRIRDQLRWAPPRPEPRPLQQLPQAWGLPLRESDGTHQSSRFLLMAPTPVEHRLTQLVAEVQDLRYELRQAVGHLPRPGSRWLTTGQLAKELGVSGRAVLSWLAAGRFPEVSYRRRQRGQGFTYMLDRQSALAAAEQILLGER